MSAKHPAESAHKTPAEVAALLNVSLNTVLAWIGDGHLRATNVARSARSKRPTWRISAAAIAEFEASRTSARAPGRAPRRSRTPDHTIRFF